MTDNTQPEALLPSRETLMAQAQVFASAWAIAGSRFDPGDGMEVAEQEKAILADMTRRLHAYCQELESQVIRDCMTYDQNPADTNTASGAADSDDALMARELYESQDDSLLLCASDLQHSAIYDNHAEMQSCMRAVAERITALASAPAQPVAEPAEGVDHG